MKVFISYTSAERDIAESIARALIAAGYEVWLDVWFIRAGDSLTNEVATALSRADALIAILSSAAIRSSWVTEELRAGLAKRIADRTFRIIPVVVGDVQPPVFLSDYRYVRWHPHPSAALAEIESALTGHQAVPEVHLEARESAVVFNSIDVLVTLSGPAAARAQFQERYRIFAQRRITRIIQEIEVFGELVSAIGDGVVLQREPRPPHHERWQLLFPEPVTAGQSVKFGLTYELEGYFSLSKPEWAIPIESPTDQLNVTFDFEKTERPRVFIVKHRVGLMEYEDSSPVTIKGSRFSWSKTAPRYRDSYVFAFEY